MIYDFLTFNDPISASVNTSDDTAISYDGLSDTHGLTCGCSGCEAPIWLLPLLEAGEDWQNVAQPLGDDVFFPPDEPQFNGDGSTASSVNATGDQGTDGLISGVRWAESIISYSNPAQASDYQVGYNYDANGNGISATEEGFSQFNSNQLDALHFSLNEGLSGGLNSASSAMAVEAFTNLSIDYDGPNGSGTIRVANSSDAATAYAFYPSNSVLGGDSFFGTPVTSAPMQAGNYQFNTAIHEMGHSLGLKHGHETDVFGAMPANVNSNEYSVMTYAGYIGADTTAGAMNEEWGFEQTWMMYDIAALQEMYGADFTSNAGDTVYSWSPTSGNTLINGQVAINPGGNRIFATIWDGDGNDTYDLSAYSTGVEVDLSPGGHSTFSSAQIAALRDPAFGQAEYARGNIFNALQYQNDPRSLIENAVGGSGNDSLTGNILDNVLEGGAGDDTLDGGAGTDDVAVYTGNQSQYTFSGDDSSATVTATVTGEGTDTLSGIEILRFADGDIRLDDTETTLDDEFSVQNVLDGFTVVQSAGDTYAGDDSDQTYNINPFLTQAGAMITIIDQGGNNSIELPAGLAIASSLVVSNQTILTLSNGAEIDIRGADTFIFNVGHSVSTGDTVGTELSFADFAQDVLGVTLPAPGEPVVQGGASTVNDDGTATLGGSTITVDENLTAVDGVEETFIYNIDSSSGDAVSLAGGSFTIDGFNGAEDSIIFDDVPSGTLSTATFGDTTPTVSGNGIQNELDFIFADNSDGDAFILTLVGVSDLADVDFSVA